MCTVVTSNFTIAGSLLGVKFLAGPRWEIHTVLQKKAKKYLILHYMVYFPHFTMHLISPCCLSWRHVSTNFCTFHFMLLGNGEGKYENLQETFNSVKKVYQGLQLPYVFSLILSLLSFPYDLWYSKQLTVFEECPNREAPGTASCPCSSHASLGTCLGPAFCWHHPAAG